MADESCGMIKPHLLLTSAAFYGGGDSEGQSSQNALRRAKEAESEKPSNT